MSKELLVPLRCGKVKHQLSVFGWQSKKDLKLKRFGQTCELNRSKIRLKFLCRLFLIYSIYSPYNPLPTAQMFIFISPNKKLWA